MTDEVPVQEEPQRRRFDQGQYGARFAPQPEQAGRPQGGGNLSKWRDTPPPGYRLTPMGRRTVTEYQPSGPVRRRMEETPFISADEMINQMPNSELLTPLERGLYRTLPRVMDYSVMGKPLGDRLAEFDEGWAGQLLSKLDFAAEGLERGYGFLSQWSDAHLYGTPEDAASFDANMAEAWYAGSLWADMTNLPGFTRDEAGNVTGMTVPGELPGRQGVVRARKRIAELTRGGMPIGEALKQVRAEYYEDLGALSIRAQMQDTYQHILLDPLNIITAYVKPVELAQARRVSALTTKLLPDTLDGLRATQKAFEVAGDLESAARVASRIEVLQDTSKTMNTLDRFSIFITGGNPFEPNVLTRIPVVKGLTLSPEARAYESLVMVSDNIDSYIFSKFDDPLEITEALYRANNGSLGPEFGHAFLTSEGRIAQSTVSAAEATAKDLYGAYDVIRAERELLEAISRNTGDDVYSVVNQLAEGNAKQLVEKLMQSDEGLQIATRIDDEFVSLVGTFELDNVPYTDELFKLYLSNAVKNTAAQMAVTKFGLQARGLVYKMSGVMKSAETLAFLRLNPTFAAKNFINNEITMLARGVGGVVSTKNLDELIDTLGFTPHRWSQAFTIAGEAGFQKTAATGERVIADVLRGEDGFLNSASDFFQQAGDRLGVLDMGALSSRAESAASMRSFYHGYLQGWNQHFWKPGKGFRTLEQALPAEVLADMPLSVRRGIESAVASAKSEAGLDAALRVKNLNLNGHAVADDIIREYGYDLGKRFTPDEIEVYAQGLTQAMETGKPSAVRGFVENIREDVFKSLDEIAAAGHEGRVGEIAAIMEMEGPNGLVRVWGDAMDDFSGGTIAYDVRMSRFDPGSLSGETASTMWNRVQGEASAYWNRQWDRLDDIAQGIKDGAKFDIPPEFNKGVRQWRKGWNDFIEQRNTLRSEFFEAIEKGEIPPRPWDDIQDELDTSYAAMVQNEMAITAAIDDTITNLVRQQNPDLAGAYAAWRQRARDLRLQDKESVIQFRRSIEGMSPKRKAAAWTEFWRERMNNHEAALWRNDSAGRAMLQGDPQALAAYQQMDEVMGAGRASAIRSLANQYGIPTATKKGVPLDRRITDTVNKYLRGEYDEATEVVADALQYATFDEIPQDVALDAFEARRLFNDPDSLPPLPKEPKGEELTTIADSSKVLHEYQAVTPPVEVGRDQHWFANGFQGLDDMEAQALRRMNEPPLSLGDLSAEQAAEVDKYLNAVKGQMADARLASVRYGEFKRDSALLNYNRRYNYNNWLSTIFPFEFWATQSLAKWAIHSIDRPAMLTTYLRMKRLIQTAGMPQNGFPSRLKSSLRFDLPFLPDWMGKEFFVDPFRTTLPFDTFAAPIEQYLRNQSTQEGRAERLLGSMVNSGQITQAEADNAAATRSGQVWATALSQAQVNDTENRTDAWDYANLFLSPHAPIMWGVEAARGTPENIGPLMPISRTFQQAFGVLGIDASRSEYNVAGKARSALGLPAYDKWEDYRVDRELSNMAAEGYNLNEIQRAMIDQEGPLWDEAVSRAARTFAGGGALPFLLKTLGIPTQAYPEGEQAQRALQDDFSRAYEAYDGGDVQALTSFFDQHPEYEARLALWDEPEERMRKFMVDDIWDRYHDLPVVHRQQMKDALGEEWQRFLSNDHQGNTFTPEQLQYWLKLMGGDPPGSLNSPTQPLELADQDVSWRVEQFYNLRGALFPSFREQQDTYFKLDDEAKRQYRQDNPQLQSYWNWRRDFFHRNPEVTPYLDDDFEFEYPSPAAAQAAQTGLPQYTFQEWSYVVGSRSTANVLFHGEIPPGTEAYLEAQAAELGITLDDMIQLVGQAQR